MTVYFVQGALGLAALALLPPDTLHLTPAEVSALGPIILPWTVKPLYGFLSDGPAALRLSAQVVPRRRRRARHVACSRCDGGDGGATGARGLDHRLALRRRLRRRRRLARRRARAERPIRVGGRAAVALLGCQAFGGLSSAYFSGSLLG